jgi:CubicO group peptidase (beta-lactamase class C family)
MRFVQRLAATAVALALCTAIAHAQAADPAAKVDALFAEFEKPDSPGYVVAVVKDGRVVHAKGYGMADLERNVHLSPQSVLDIGSTSKQFSAACLFLLARQGKLSLDDDVRKLLPEMRDYGTPVTIRHLIHHTSGVRDYLTLMAIAGQSGANDYPDAYVVDLIARQRELNFKPGDEFLYSNSGYFLMSEIVRRASGMPLSAYAEKHIFGPLGMKNTHFHDDTSVIVKNRAIGYSPKDGGGWAIDMSIFHVVGDGGVLTTVEDLAIWDRNFYDSKLEGGRELIDAMQVVGTLNGGAKLDYAAGLFVGNHRGLKAVRHGGAWVGYRAEMLRFPDERLTVICLANHGTANPSQMAERVAEIYLGAKLGPAPGAAAGTARPVDAKPVALAPEALKAREGLYRDTAAGTFRRLAVRDGKLFYVRSPESASELVPVAADRFVMANVPNHAEVAFPAVAAGARARMTVTVDGGKPSVFEAVDAVAPSAAELADLAGTYYSEEVDAILRVKVEGGALFVADRYDPAGARLEPTVRDEFSGPGISVAFKRDAAGRVAGLAVGAGRVRNIGFVRR